MVCAGAPLAGVPAIPVASRLLNSSGVTASGTRRGGSLGGGGACVARRPNRHPTIRWKSRTTADTLAPPRRRVRWGAPPGPRLTPPPMLVKQCEPAIEPLRLAAEPPGRPDPECLQFDTEEDDHAR